MSEKRKERRKDIMKKNYETLKMTVVLLACENVMTRSGEVGGDDDKTGEWDE